MDLGVVVSSDSLVQRGGGIAVLEPASVIRASVTTRGIVSGGQLAVGADQGLCEGVGSAVDVVSLNSNNLGRSRLEAING